jgi:hypothetical protein
VNIIHLELLIEFAVILLAPVIHTYYLWKVKKVDASVIRQNEKIFSFFYVLLGVTGIVLLLKN